MKYSKPAKTFEEQADLLLERGLIADRDQLIRRLRVTSYFRLTTYLYRFRVAGSEKYHPGTTLERVWKLYNFDQRLRTLLLDAIEAIEVHTRTQLAYHFAHDCGAFAYKDPRHFPNLNSDRFSEWQWKLDEQVRRSRKSREEFVTHFFAKYGDQHTDLPIWMLVELMDFGSTLTFFRAVKDDIKKRIAAEIGQPDVVGMSWLLALNTIRNRCAHHSRLWDWELGTPVHLPQQRKFPAWHAPALPSNRVGIILTICHHWLRSVSPSNASEWTTRLRGLFDEYPDQPVLPMGLVAGWKEHPLWKT